MTAAQGLAQLAINDYIAIVDVNENAMASITIRNLDDELKQRLRVQAASHGRSMEEEVRDILRAAVNREASLPKDLGAAIHARFAKLGGVELELPPRESIREPPRFDEDGDG